LETIFNRYSLHGKRQYMVFITWASEVSIPYLKQVGAITVISSHGAILVRSKNRANRLNTS